MNYVCCITVSQIIEPIQVVFRMDGDFLPIKVRQLFFLRLFKLYSFVPHTPQIHGLATRAVCISEALEDKFIVM